MEATTGDILVVDDNPANLELMAGLLRSAGYGVRLVPSGRLALMAARRDPPDLFILDVRMPGMDGFELCERLKADASLADIPVVFLSGATEPREKLRAFTVGAVDYVTKPFSSEEVEARVRTHLTLKRLREQIEERNAQLDQMYRQLQEVESVRDDLVHMLVHDMKTPLMVADISLQMLRQDLEDLQGESADDLHEASGAIERLKHMVRDMLDVRRIEEGHLPIRKRRIALEEVAKRAVALASAASREADIAIAEGSGRCVLDADPELVERVLVNLLTNAVSVSAGKPVELAYQGDEETGFVRVTVRDQGPGIDPADHEKIFDTFGQVELRRLRRKHSTGLGLTLCRLAVEAHGGRIGVESALGEGATFWLLLPQRGTERRSTDDRPRSVSATR